MSSQLYPEVVDASTFGARYSQPLFLTIGLEGQAAASGTANVGQIYSIVRPSESDTYFGATSSLGVIVKLLLSRGVSPVFATASIVSASAPTLGQRQTAWSNLESDERIRLRMTDSTTQADLAALAVSCNNADLLFNKQIGFGGLASGSAKSTLLTAASAIASKRFCLVGPGVYDNTGTLLSGNMAAAAAAAEISKNADIADDLDTFTLVNLTGIENDSQGMPLLRKKVSGGIAINDYEDLLQGGVSPLQNTPQGNGVEITHLRTTWTTDPTFDALMTRLIVDQVFIEVRNYARASNYLRRGNTPKTRADLQAGVEALLGTLSGWILPVTRSDGSQGYNVAVTPSSDNRAVFISYEGFVVRSIQTIRVDAKLSIAA